MPLFPCDPQALINSAVCFDKCIPPGAQREVALYLLCQWANAASAPTPVPPPPPAPELSLTAFMLGSDAYLSPVWTESSDPALDFLFCYGTTSGGPYPDCVSFVASDRNGVVPGVVAGTTYYGVIQARDSVSVVSASSNEASATPVPPLTGFSYEPPTTVIIWIDKNGYQNGNLAAFNATADAPSVTTLTLEPGVTSATGFAHFPLLSNISVGYGLTVFWVNSILVELAAMFSVNGGPTNIDLSGQASPAPPDSGPPDGLTAYNYLANMPGVDIRTD